MEHRFVYPVVREICPPAAGTLAAVTGHVAGGPEQVVRTEAERPRKGR